MVNCSVPTRLVVASCGTGAGGFGTVFGTGGAGFGLARGIDADGGGSGLGAGGGGFGAVPDAFGTITAGMGWADWSSGKACEFTGVRCGLPSFLFPRSLRSCFRRYRRPGRT